MKRVDKTIRFLAEKPGKGLFIEVLALSAILPAFMRDTLRLTAKPLPTFTLARADAGGHLLTADKNNFGPQQDLLCYAIDFLDEGEHVCFRRLDQADEEMAGAMQHMSTHEITLLAIKSIYQDTGATVSPDEVVTWRNDRNEAGGVKSGTIRNHFTVLKKRGKIELMGDGRAVPAIHDFIHDGKSDTSENRPKRPENGHSRFTIPIDIVNRESSPGGDDMPVDFEFDD